MIKLYTIKEAAEIFRVDRSTIWRWNKKGIIKVLEVGGRRLVSEQEIKRLTEKDLKN